MENIQQKMATFFNGTCYGYCLTHYFKPNFSVAEMSLALLNAWNYKYLEDDAYVAFPIKYVNYVLGITNVIDVTKVQITSLSELPKGEWIVEYKKLPTDKESHFVIATSKKITFDPSGNSNTVKVGKPVSYRKFIYKK